MKKTKHFILSVGGSLIVRPTGIDTEFLKEFRAFILKQVEKGYRFHLVVGGGVTARNYIQAASAVTSISEPDCDWIGIGATRLNAQLLRACFGAAAYAEIVVDPRQRINPRKKIVIAAGYKPGWSTDYVAVLLAQNNKVDAVINLSNIDYAYDKDPKIKGAQRLETVSWEVFRKIVGNRWQPGLSAPFDPIASRVAAQSDLKVIILNGRKIENLQQCLEGKKFIGTTIS